MSQLESVFTQKNHKALIAYVTVGYPSLESTLKIVPVLADCGCDIVELGIPFSDPMADGATIQRASFKALKNGVTTKLCLDTAKKLSKKVSIPLVFMTYFNPVNSYGLEKFCRDCDLSGISGLIVPDLTPDEGQELETITQKNELDLIYLLAPTSTEERIRLVGSKSRGFIYLVSIAGVTGARSALPADLGRFVAKVRKTTERPICVGFGISTPEQAGQVAQIADGVIIGSKLIQLLEADDEKMKKTQAFIKAARKALDGINK
ncbi:MAG: tryptophan synthase subunit alpha [Dehalococcoidales bacterium]|nr:tryptophan synthase subunit alpha [Dehalococcoidales bacterium]